MTANTHFVIVEHKRFSGRYVALRGVTYATRADAEAHIEAAYKPAYRANFHVEERKVKIDDGSLRLHCQICERAILANSGRIAHHGYERPGHGWQTSSCPGAKELPFEVSREKLGRTIAWLKNNRTSRVFQLAAVGAEEVPVTHAYSVYDRRLGRNLPFVVTFTRETFDAVKAEHPRGFDGRYGEDATFDGYLKRDIADRQHGIEQVTETINHLQARYDGWKQTHERRDGKWEAL